MILHLEWAKQLREQGEKLGREGMSQRVGIRAILDTWFTAAAFWFFVVRPINK